MKSRPQERIKSIRLPLDDIYDFDNLAKQYGLSDKQFFHHLLKQQLQYAPQNKQEENIKTMMKKLNEMDRDNKELKSQINQDSAAKIEGLIRANSKLENNISGLNEQIEGLHKQIEDIEAQAIIEIEELQENNQRLLGMFSKSPKVQLHELTEEMERYRVRTIEAEQMLKACLKERSGLIADKEQLEKQGQQQANMIDKQGKQFLTIMLKIMNGELSQEQIKAVYEQMTK